MDLSQNRVVSAFASQGEENKKTLVPFITAGYPSLEVTGRLLEELSARGVKVAEVGIPFSDPIADGPTIQASYTESLGAGTTLEKIFATVSNFRKTNSDLALLAMVSYSIVYRHGVEQFLLDAVASGFDGLIVPDLPLDEASEFSPLAASKGLCSVMLIAPTTPVDRRAEIAQNSTGFVYFISVAGITGERTVVPPETIAAVAELRKHTETPICVGFGISKPETVAKVCAAGDGAIVGSAIIHRITDNKNESTETIAAAVGDFVEELLAPIL